MLFPVAIMKISDHSSFYSKYRKTKKAKIGLDRLHSSYPGFSNMRIFLSSIITLQSCKVSTSIKPYCFFFNHIYLKHCNCWEMHRLPFGKLYNISKNIFHSIQMCIYKYLNMSLYSECFFIKVPRLLNPDRIFSPLVDSVPNVLHDLKFERFLFLLWFFCRNRKSIDR